MIKTLSRILVTLAILLGITSATPAYADCATAKECAQQGLNTANTTKGTTVGGLLKTISTTLLFVLGGVAVIMIIVGGIKYTTSQGDQTAVTSAKNTILYSVIGLLVAVFAYAIVNFVVTSFVK